MSLLFDDQLIISRLHRSNILFHYYMTAGSLSCLLLIYATHLLPLTMSSIFTSNVTHTVVVYSSCFYCYSSAQST